MPSPMPVPPVWRRGNEAMRRAARPASALEAIISQPLSSFGTLGSAHTTRLTAMRPRGPAAIAASTARSLRDAAMPSSCRRNSPSSTLPEASTAKTRSRSAVVSAAVAAAGTRPASSRAKSSERMPHHSANATPVCSRGASGPCGYLERRSCDSSLPMLVKEAARAPASCASKNFDVLEAQFCSTPLAVLPVTSKATV